MTDTITTAEPEYGTDPQEGPQTPLGGTVEVRNGQRRMGAERVAGRIQRAVAVPEVITITGGAVRALEAVPKWLKHRTVSL